MKKDTSQNIKLGIFVIMGSILLVLTVFFIGSKKDLFQNTSKISSVFKNVSGLQKGNNVRLSGVNVGTVRGIKILNDTAIVVDMFIDDNTLDLIKKNSIASISSDGLVGSMIVDIRPGNEPFNEIVKAGDTIPSINRIPTSEMLRTLRTTNRNAALLTKDLLKITKSINNGEGVMGALLKDDKLVGNIKHTFSNLEQTSKTANRAINRLNEILDQVDLKEGVAGVLLSDTIAANNMRGVFVSLEKAAQDIDSLTTNLNQFSADLNNSQGPLNFVLKDTTFAKNLDSTIQNSQDASVKFNEIMDALKQSFLFRGYFRKLERQKEKQVDCVEKT
jgi:phospholipid/cholesterol/gamma-HCH transport system substrate-binding protein